MKLILKTIPRCLCFLLAFAIIGYFAVAAAYAFPEETIVYNASASTDFLVSSYIGKDTVWMNWPDYFTDIVMLNIASYNSDGQTVYYRAIANEKVGETFEIIGWLSERTPLTKIYYTFEEGSTYNGVTSYGKYWNGYLVFLRPLLLYFNMWQIYQIFKVLMTICFVLTGIIMLWKTPYCFLPFLCAFLALRPYTKYCLTYAIINILVCVFLCIIALNKAVFTHAGKRLVLFFCIGAIANYFTLMSYTFVIALFGAVYISCSWENKHRTIWGVAEDLGLMLLYYAAGYCSMWVAKWMLLLLSDKHLLDEVIYSVGLRMSHEESGNNISLAEALLWNACGFYYQNKAIITSCILMVLSIFISSFLFVKMKTENRKRSWAMIMQMMLIFLVTVIATITRYALVLNHSRVHYFFMNRLLAGPLFALMCVCFLSMRDIVKVQRLDEQFSMRKKA